MSTRRTFVMSLAAGVAAGAEGPKILALAPRAPERLARIEEMKKKAAAVTGKFEARVFEKGEKPMPYRLFQPERRRAGAKLPLIVYLHGAGGLGDDNLKQLRGGNLLGSHVWALEENQARQAAYIVAPQTDHGWIRYDAARTRERPRPTPVAGLGQGAAVVLEIIAALRKEFAIDEKRLYVMGNSMGGGGTWHLLAQRPGMFAAGIPVAGARGADDAARVGRTPVWNFHGTADETVDIATSRGRIAALRAAGGQPLVTEYEGIGHNANEWAFSEPAVVEWLYGQRLG